MPSSSSSSGSSSGSGSSSDSSAGSDSTQALVLQELTHVVEPLEYLTRDSTASVKLRRTKLLLIEMGYEEQQVDAMIDPVHDVLSGLQSSFQVIEDVVGLIKSGDLSSVSFSEYQGHVENVKGLFSGIKKLDDVVASLDVEQLGTRLMDYLITRYLQRYHYRVYTTLRLIAVIEEPDDGPTKLHFENLGTLFSDPNRILIEQFGWGGGDAEFRFEFFAEIFVAYFETFEMTTKPSLVSADDAASGEPRVEPSGVQTPILLNNPKDGGAAYDVGVYWLPLTAANGDARTGIAMVPYGKLSYGADIPLGKGWTLAFDAAVKENDFLVFADPSGLEVKLPDSTQETLPEGEISAELKNQSDSKKGTVVLGDRNGTNLHYDSMSIGTGLSVGDDAMAANVEAALEAGLSIKPQGGFLEKILPPEGVNGDFSITTGWSTKRGVYFDGAAKLATTIPINASIGKKGAKLELVEVYLALSVGGDAADVRLTGAVTATAQLGPISGTVKQMGIHGDLNFPADRDGNLGAADLSIAFKPPTGVGLSIDSPGVSGGGFLEYDKANERYAAIISLTIGPVQVQVFGLLATEMPDGSDGFSLLISVFGEFPPVQLSFGFTLNGLGGVLGINRKLRASPLRKAARTGALENVLFPENPAANPTQLISDLRSIYPVTRGQHVFGPMARIGWGTPNQLQLDVGVVLQLPTFKIAILGVFRAGLPAIELPEPAKILEINLSVVGTVEPQKQLVAVAASLYDSRVVLWTMKGSMAMRLRWGDKPAFLLAVGGFHPRFQPPERFPPVDRVIVQLALPGGNPSVQWSGYFALTSNTVQAGAAFEAKFVAGPARAKGWWSIDALFQFKPFKFVVGLSAGIEVSIKGFTLAIKLEGSLQGPSPTHIRGKLTIVLPGPLPDVSPKVHITLGEDRTGGDTLPTANVHEELATQAEKPGNWAAQLPEGGEELVSLRDVEPDEQTVLAHPMGRLSVRQTVVPLKRPVEKYGENRPIHREFGLAVAADSGASLPAMRDTTESFAPEKYEQLSDSEKLNAPSFTDMTAGSEVDGNLFHWGCEPEVDGSATETPGNAASAELRYEPSREEPFPGENVAAELGMTDGGQTEETERRPAYPPVISRSLADDGSVANAERRHTGDGKFRPDGPEYDPVEHRSNGDVAAAGSLVVRGDPTVLDAVRYTAATTPVATTATGATTGASGSGTANGGDAA